MISINDFVQLTTETYNGNLVSKCKFDLVGLSTDTKPITTYNGSLIGNGSTFLSMDTGTVHMYDETGTRWVEL